MEKKLALGIMLTLLLISMLTLAFNIYPISATDLEFPAIYIEPAITVDEELTPGKNYTISIHTDYNGSDIWGYQFHLTYNPSVLEGVEVVNGDLITEDNVTFVAGTFNNTEGKLGLTVAYSSDETVPFPYPLLNNTGPGVLAYVTFAINDIGCSSIEIGITHTKMKRTDGSDIIEAQSMPDHIGHGYFINAGTLCPDYIALNATYHALLADYNSLLDDYNVLMDSYDILVTYFDSLNSSYYELTSSYESLNSTYYDLLDMYSQLQSDYDDLESKHDTLTGDLGTARNLSYLFIITTIVFIATTVYLAIRKPKVKPELKTT